jgi:hypothetical protein
MRDDLKPHARFNLLEADKCDGSIIGHGACSPGPIRRTKGLTIVTCERPVPLRVASWMFLVRQILVP